jgi:2-haloacid dehalogenase/putative hydrolase of the HAD superfamily
MSRKYDALFLDFYGTLVVGDRAAVEATCARIVSDYGLPMSAASLATAWGRRFFDAIESCNDLGFINLFDCECRTLTETVADLVHGIDPRPYAEMLRTYWACPPLAPNVIEALSAIDIPMCIVSNADTADVLAAIACHKLPISEVVTSEDARSYKPHRGIFDTALKRMRVSPNRVLHAGDSLHSDVGGARAVGINTCWVHYTDRIMDVGECTPDHRITDLSELPALLTR